ncbi:hypothetical protein B0T21DRAFT_348287 [Apiosordaria backusii]|uniref:Uncharacterized protein n=1 Tax=Apiosordaria backusii TaxID=314023 RepID=A0AA40BL25_9PEZI|nr:hypothetical protein B0T21DRAFT_348287 [Apiosordaria backusii]
MFWPLDSTDIESATDRECAVRRRSIKMLLDFFEALFNSGKSITPTGEEVEEETHPEKQPSSSRRFIPNKWEKKNLLYLSSAVSMGLGYLEKVQLCQTCPGRRDFGESLDTFKQPSILTVSDLWIGGIALSAQSRKMMGFSKSKRR